MEWPRFHFAYLSLALFVGLFVGHKTYSVIRSGVKWPILKPDEMDLATDREEIEAEEKLYSPVGTGRKDRFLHWLWG